MASAETTDNGTTRQPVRGATDNQTRQETTDNGTRQNVRGATDNQTRQETTDNGARENVRGAPGSQTQPTADRGEIQSERIVIPLHREELQVGKRMVESGTVRLRKEITTETISEPVQLRKETLVVEREQASGSSQSSQQGPRSQLRSQSGELSQAFEPGELVVRLQSEEPVIEKRIVSAGSIVLETKATTEQVNVRQQVRRETVAVDKSGNAQNVTISDSVNQSRARETAGAPERRVRVVADDDRTATPREDETAFPRPQPDGKKTFPELQERRQEIDANASTEPRQTKSSANSGTITDWQQLSATADASSLEGKPVNISNAKADEAIGQNLLCVSGENGQKTLVKSKQSLQNIKPGQKVNITGTVRKMPADPAQLGLDQKAAQKFQGQKVYIEVAQITPN